MSTTSTLTTSSEISEARETDHPIEVTGNSQAERIFSALALNPGTWLAMPYLASVSGAYAVHSRIADLRQRGHVVEQKNEYGKKNVCRSFYRLVLQSES